MKESDRVHSIKKNYYTLSLFDIFSFDNIDKTLSIKNNINTIKDFVNLNLYTIMQNKRNLEKEEYSKLRPVLKTLKFARNKKEKCCVYQHFSFTSFQRKLFTSFLHFIQSLRS